MNQNHGVLVAQPRVTDYLLGTNSQISIARLVKDWSIYLPDNETQRSSVVDFLDCVSMSMIHTIEMQCNYLYKTNQMPDELLNFLTDNGYIQNGKVKFSVRYSAKMNGTDISKGQYQNLAGDHVRKDGLYPDSKLGMTNSMTWVEYYATITPGAIALAQKILWFLNIQYQWINKADMPLQLLQAPIQVATEVCAGWDSGEVVPLCSGQPLQHATVIYGQDSEADWLDLDHYAPYKQKLAENYELPSNMQFIVSIKPTALRNGMRGSNVLSLQQNLNKVGYSLKSDGSFGPLTAQAVIDFQGKHGLTKDGVSGPITLEKLSTVLSTVSPATTAKIDLFCEAICKYEGANPANNNPFDLKDGHYTQSNGSTGVDKNNGIAIFPDYQIGYNAGKKLIVSACSGQIPAYNENGTIVDFFDVYAPSSDSNNPTAYADWVGLQIGVDAETFIIKDLL